MKLLKFKLLLILICTGASLFAQTSKITVKATDTIDYMYLSSAKGYSLTKIMDLRTSVLQRCGKNFLFQASRIDSTSIAFAKKNGKTLSVNDSLLYISWFLINKTECFPQDCAHYQPTWKLSINRKNNVFVLDKIFCIQAQDLKHIVLKVIKLSEFEIILEDMTDSIWHRRYYFQKN